MRTSTTSGSDPAPGAGSLTRTSHTPGSVPVTAAPGTDPGVWLVRVNDPAPGAGSDPEVVLVLMPPPGLYMTGTCPPWPRPSPMSPMHLTGVLDGDSESSDDRTRWRHGLMRR